MACFWSHHFGKVQEDGFQYCVDCGVARRPIIPDPPKCSHEWETVSKETVNDPVKDYYGNVVKYVQTGKKYDLRCKKCGDMSSRILSVR